MHQVLADWENFFTAQVGSAAALTGLLFVAVSINLGSILRYPHLPLRAIEALVALISVLVVSTIGLIPSQTLAAYGVQILASGVVVSVIQALLLVQTAKASAQHKRLLPHVLISQTPSVPYIVAGAQMIGGDPNGAYWIVTGVFLSFAAGLLGAWVLLVEIQR